MNEHGNLGIGRWSILINEGRWIPRNFDILIIELLQYAIQGRVSKILLSVPSRHGKSTLISKNFVSYFLTHFPNDHVILSAYSHDLASDFGGQVKDIVNYYGHYSPYNVKLSEDTKSKSKFNIAKPYNGQMLAVGAGGGLLGFGAGLFIIDDPIKNIAEAESKARQEKLRDWIGGTAKTRLEKRNNGLPPIMIVIAQRLHLNDLHGIIKETEPYIDAKTAYTILRSGGKISEDTWVDFNLPAICEDPTTDLLGRKVGDVLWEKQRDYEWLMAEKRAMGSYLFNAIYQGHPQERDGEIFKRGWFYDELTNKLTCTIPKSELPKDLPLLRYWDFGASADAGDGTSGLLSGYDGHTLYFIDLIAGKFSARKVLRTFKKACLTDGKHVRVKVEQEPGAGSKLLINKFKHEKELRGWNIRADKVKVSKKVRAYDLEAICEDRRLKIVEGHWNETLVDQLIAFTGEEGGVDDIVDTCSGSARHWLRYKRRINI